MSGLKYAVIGAGRQGLAAAHDFVVHGGAEKVVLADVQVGTARAAAEALDKLVGRRVGEPVRVDAQDDASLRRVLHGVDAVLSALPYALNPRVASAAIASHAHYADLGGNTAISSQVLALDAHARQARVTLVPDCGLAPGLSATLAAYLMDLFEEPDSLRLRCGGLPQQPKGPLDYMLVFSFEGLVNEYLGAADVLRDGKPARVPTLDELEEIDFPAPLGRCEAFTTSGGTSTLPVTYAGRLRELDYKTVRYSGHCAKVRALRDLGLLSDQKIKVGQQVVTPREVTAAVTTPALTYPGEKDLVVLRAEISGRHAGRPARWRVDVLDFHDDATGFSAMQRMTGYPAAMVVEALARGDSRPGATPLESAVAPAPLVAGLRARGIRLVETRE